MVGGDFLDLHAAFGRGDQCDPPGRPIDQQRDVKFARDVTAGFDINAVHRASGGAGLFRYQDVADHRVGGGSDVVDGVRDADAALAVWIVRETAGTAAAGVDLRLHHEYRTGEFSGGGGGFVRGPRDVSVQNRDAMAFQQF